MCNLRVIIYVFKKRIYCETVDVAGAQTWRAIVARSDQPASAPAHPEEIRAKVKLRLGKRSRLNATLRTTPAGLVTAAIMTAAIFLSIAALVRAARRRY